MSITINGATNTLTAASGLTIAGNTAVTGTLSATGTTSITSAQSTLQQTSSTGTNPVVHSFANTGGTYYNGVNDSSAVQFGGNAYSLVRYAPATRTIQDIIGGTGAITTVSSTGLAVTGTLSSTGVTDASRFKPTGAPSSSEAGLSLYSSGFWLNTPSGTTGYLGVNGSGVAAITSTGLAVTGTLSSTGAIGAGIAANSSYALLAKDPTAWSQGIGFTYSSATTQRTGAIGTANSSAAMWWTAGTEVTDNPAAANGFTALSTGAAGINLNGDGAGGTRIYGASGLTAGVDHSFDASASTGLIATFAPTLFSTATNVIASVLNTTDATSTTAASLKTAGGLGVVGSAYFGGRVNSALFRTTSGQVVCTATVQSGDLYTISRGATIFDINCFATGAALQTTALISSDGTNHTLTILKSGASTVLAIVGNAIRVTCASNVTLDWNALRIA